MSKKFPDSDVALKSISSGGIRIALALTLVCFQSMTDEIKAQIRSPEVSGNEVTFRFRAPKANGVSVVGVAGKEELALKKGSDGIWTGSLTGLTPELYSYSFEVDGTRVTDPSNREVKKWLSCNSMFEIRGGLLHEQKEVPHGELHEIFYQSEATNSQRKALVYLPPGGFEQKDLDLLFLLHGFGDDHLAWKEVGRANFVADNLIEDNKIRPCVIVMPYGHPLPLDLRREFDDYADQNATLMQKDLVKSLLPHIQNRYPVSRSRTKTGVVGLSMGGGQSIRIGLNCNDHFSTIGGFSSAAPQGTEQALASEFKTILSDVSQFNQRTDLFWIGCGKDDFLFERNNKFVDWMKKAGIQHEYNVSEGGHDWIVWRKYLAQFLIKAFPKR